MKSSRFLVAALVVVTAMMAGCAPRRSVLQSAQADSVRIEIVRRDVTVYDTVSVELPELRESVTIVGDTSVLENRFARSEAIVLSGGELKHSLETIPQKLEKPVELQVEVRDSVVYRERLITRIIESECELSSWQRFCISGFYLLLALIVVGLFLLLR